MPISGSPSLEIRRIEIAHEFVLNKDNVCEYPNGREYYGIIYCIEGEAEYIFSSGVSCGLREGNIIILSPDARYSVITKNDFKHFTVNFEINKDSLNIDFLSGDFYVFKTDNSQWYFHNFKNLVDTWESRKSCYEMRAMACLYELIADIVSEILEKEHGTTSFLRLKPAKEYIDQHFQSDITLDFLSKYVNMSVTNFRREWLNLFGESPLKYRDRIRLSYAKDYIKSGYYTVSEVAEKCGFDDVNYFIRFFRKHIGIPPGKYKKLL